MTLICKEIIKDILNLNFENNVTIQNIFFIILFY